MSGSKWSVILFIFALLGTLIPVHLVEGDGDAQIVGRLVFQGAVQIENNGQIKFRKAGRSGQGDVPAVTPLYPNDKVLTANNTKANINLANGAVIWMEGQAGIQISEKAINIPQNVNASFAILGGSVRVHVNKYRTETDKYDVITPASVCGARGTEFMVGVAVTGSSSTMVYDGTVEVETDESTRSTSLTENQGGTVDLGSNKVETKTVAEPILVKKETESFQNQEKVKSDKDPEATVNKIHHVMVGVKENNEKTVKKINTISKDIPQDAEEIPQKSVNDIQEVDRKIAVNNGRSEALKGLAENVVAEHPENAKVQKVFQEVQKTYTENELIKQEFGEAIAALSERIDKFVEVQEEKFNRFTGGELDF